MPCRTSHRVLAGTAPTRAAGTFSHTTPDRDCASYLNLGREVLLVGVTASEAAGEPSAAAKRDAAIPDRLLP